MISLTISVSFCVHHIASNRAESEQHVAEAMTIIDTEQAREPIRQHVVVRNLAGGITQSNTYLDVQYDRRKSEFSSFISHAWKENS